ncbi:MAG: HAD family phosphatase [Pseudomonadota bacterium]
MSAQSAPIDRTPLDTVIFDIGNVLVYWDPRFLIQKLGINDTEFSKIMNDVITLEWHTHHDRGRSMKTGVALLTAEYPQFHQVIETYRTRWFETILGSISETIDILRNLAERPLQLVALTNFSAETFDEFCDRYPFMKLFHAHIVSGRVGLIKPDPKIYELTERQCELSPHRTLFIDDRVDNIRTAQNRGWHGHVFSTSEGLRAALAKFTVAADGDPLL